MASYRRDTGQWCGRQSLRSEVEGKLEAGGLVPT